MKTKKDRRHSGREVTKIYHPEDVPLEEVKWSDWNDYRDGQRNIGRDRTRLCHHVCGHKECYERLQKINNKIKKQKQIRKVKKAKRNELRKNIKCSVCGKRTTAWVSLDITKCNQCKKDEIENEQF